uniref:Ig-like domain-containing protein n=1 Tax=Equus caballus TaxID=9796 RepID=A0A3Q2I6R7_HORSE
MPRTSSLRDQKSEQGDTCLVLPHRAMSSTLLCCVALCLLGAGPVDSGVTQTPRHLVKTRGQQVTLRCSPMSGHDTVSWYRQPLGQGLQFLIQYYRGEENGKGDFPGRFKGQQLDNYSSELNVSVLELVDSALYFCASSLAQPCMISSLQNKNLPAPAQEVTATVVAARQTNSGPHISDRPSPDTIPAASICNVFYAHRNNAK